MRQINYCGEVPTSEHNIYVLKMLDKGFVFGEVKKFWSFKLIFDVFFIKMEKKTGFFGHGMNI